VTYQTVDSQGNVELSSRTASRHFYDAADQLIAVQKYSLKPDGSVGTDYFGTWEEYRYDALGRRVLVRNRPDSLCDQSAQCKPFIQRTVWSGNKVLLEMRVESSDSTEASNPSQLDQIWTGGEQYGRVAYTHGAALDRPLDIMKHDGTSGSVIVPHYNWRGLAEAVTDTTGAKLCPAATGCPTNQLPGSYATAFRGNRNTEGAALPQWWGALIVDQQDQSGLLYRRNRYYDAATGQFTQEDPIGLAGGLNLYGFANGDPINFSDPFGLRACPTCARLAIGGAAGFLAEGAWQLYSGDFDGGRLVGSTLLGGLGGMATKIPGVGRYAAQATLGAGASTLDGQIDPGAMIVGGFFGVAGEAAGSALTSSIANEGVKAVRTRLFAHFDEMIAHGRSAEDAIVAAQFFDRVVSENSRGAAVGTLTGLLLNSLQDEDGGRE